MLNKICRICNINKPLIQFSARKDSADGHRAECKQCLNAARRASPSYGKWHKENRQRVKDYMKYYDLKRNYGITQEQFNNILKSQGGVCKVCGTSDWMGRGKKPHVDHCHTTGKIRGLLCNLCNVGIGAFKENTESMKRAIQYLLESK